jgi:hypothetical protein
MSRSEAGQSRGRIFREPTQGEGSLPRADRARGSATQYHRIRLRRRARPAASPRLPAEKPHAYIRSHGVRRAGRAPCMRLKVGTPIDRQERVPIGAPFHSPLKLDPGGIARSSTRILLLELAEAAHPFRLRHLSEAPQPRALLPAKDKEMDEGSAPTQSRDRGPALRRSRRSRLEVGSVALDPIDAINRGRSADDSILPLMRAELSTLHASNARISGGGPVRRRMGRRHDRPSACSHSLSLGSRTRSLRGRDSLSLGQFQGLARAHATRRRRDSLPPGRGRAPRSCKLANLAPRTRCVQDQAQCSHGEARGGARRSARDDPGLGDRSRPHTHARLRLRPSRRLRASASAELPAHLRAITRTPSSRPTRLRPRDARGAARPSLRAHPAALLARDARRALRHRLTASRPSRSTTSAFPVGEDVGPKSPPLLPRPVP